MKTLGSYLARQRKKKKISLATIARRTRIKKEFLVAIEEGNWKALPEFSIVLGFVKSITRAIGLDSRFAIALLKRDYLVKVPALVAKPELSRATVWNPKATFIGGVGAVILFISLYLFWEYFSFVRPPMLEVLEPAEGQGVEGTTLEVSGKTDAGATMVVNNQPVIVARDGTFEDKVRIYEGTSEIIFVAKSRSGKETVVSRTIKVELKN